MTVKFNKIILIVFFIVLSFAIYFFADKTISKQQNTVNENDKYSLVVTGFGFVNVFGVANGEIAPFYKALDNSNSIQNTNFMCESSYAGEIFGNKVILASTGMGKVRSSACVLQILNNYFGDIKEVIFVGIAGASRQQLSSGQKTEIGDLCINYQAFDFDLQYYLADKKQTKEAFPQYFNLSDSFGLKYSVGDKKLAEKLIKNASNFRVWNIENCIEATSDTYWHDLRSDQRAREIASEYLKKDPSEIVIFTSMEGNAVGTVIQLWNKNTNQQIPFAYVRSASNFDAPNQDYSSKEPLENGWDSLNSRNSKDTQKAIETAGVAVLSMFKNQYE